MGLAQAQLWLEVRDTQSVGLLLEADFGRQMVDL